MRKLNRLEAIAHRFAVDGLTGKLPRTGLAQVARPGLQDGSPRSALLSLAARIETVRADDWRHPELAQVFGPRGAIYVVPAEDVDVFTKGLLPRDPGRVAELVQTAARVHEVLEGEPRRQSEVVAAMPEGVNSRELRWAACLGSFVPVWDTIDTIVHERQPSDLDPEEARRDLARRFYRYLGPATIGDLQWWLAGSMADAAATTDAIRADLEEIRLAGTNRLVVPPVIEAPIDPDSIHLLPPDDTYISRRTRDTLLPEPKLQRLLWPQAPPPGALVIAGEVAGTWRRRSNRVEITTWSDIPKSRRADAEAIVAEWPVGKTDAHISWRVLG